VGISPTFECTMDVATGTQLVVGAGPLGTRAVAGVGTGTVTGERLSGTVVGPGADWVLLGPDGFARLDVRLQIETHDGAFVYVQYLGVLETNEAAMAAIVDPTRQTDWDDCYFRTTPRFETGDARYAWLNQSVFVARGRLTTGGVMYEVYRV
jgi:hypothetical protein